MKKLLVLGMAIILASCGTAKKAATVAPVTNPDQLALTKGQSRWSDYTTAQFEQGRTVYTTNCQKCHGLKTVTDFDETQWNKIIPNMSKKAKISDADKDIMTKYLIASCK